MRRQLNQWNFCGNIVRRRRVELHQLLLFLLRACGIHKVAVARSLGLNRANRRLGFRSKLVNFLGRKHATLGKNFLLLWRQRRAEHWFVASILLALAAGKFLNFFAYANAAPIMSAHGAEIRVHIQVLIVIGAGGVGIK